MEIITVKNVSFTYPDADEKVIDDISFTIKEGEFLTIFGASGSGKTTLLKLLKKELTPHGTLDGAIYYGSTQLDKVEERKLATDIGYVMQHPDHQIVTDKVWHELAFGLENIGVETTEIRRRVGEMANFFGIHHWFHKETQQLSGGQKQLLNLAGTMVMQPKVLILDEPTSQLDPIAAAEFIHMLEKINRDLGITIILVEHDLEEVFPIADRVLLLDEGKIILNEQPRHVGTQLKELYPTHAMIEALPTVVKIFHQLEFTGDCPLTVREGKEALTKNYKNDIPSLGKVSVRRTEAPTMLSLENIWFRYDKDLPDVLGGVNLSVKKGEIISILGGNGSGKTTLLNVLAGQYRAYHGKVTIAEKPLKKYKQKDLYKNLLAVLPQDPQSVFIKSTVKEDYAEISKVMGYTKDETAEKTKEVLSQLGISHLIERHPYDVSGGEQQKIALGKILLLEPEIILLDEPTKGIDAFSKLMLRDIIKDLQAAGKTIIIVTHDIEFAALTSDRCGLFFDKEIISLDEPTAFFTKNNFYTTMANRISRHRYENTITYDEVIKICQMNGEKTANETV